MSRSRPLAITGLLALAALSGAVVPALVMGQGGFAVPAEPTVPNPSGLRKEAKDTWETDMRVLKEEQIQAESDRTVGLRNCKKDKACERQVMDAYHDRQREIANQKTQKTAQYKKILLEISEMERRYKQSQRARPAPRP